LIALTDIWYPVRVLGRWLNSLLLLTFAATASAAQPVPLVSIVFEGNSAVDAAQLRSRLRFQREGTVYQPEMLQLELRSLERFYQDEGYLRAALKSPSVDIRDVPGVGRGAVVSVPVFEGPRYTLASLEIRNARELSRVTLLEMSPVGIGQPYSRQRLDEWTGKVMEAYHTLGYLRATARLHESIDEAKHAVDCVLECIEGDVYRIRHIGVAGLDGAGTREFMKRILFGIDMPYNPEMLMLSLHLLNSMGIYKPMSEQSVKVTVDDETKSVRLEFHPVLLKDGPNAKP